MVLLMQRDLIREGLLVALAQHYREDPSQFLTLSKGTVDSAVAREILAELRNEGHVEEEMRGVIRLTQRGYMAFKNDPLPYSYKN
jgi:predicted transcriptional regulator